MSVLLYIVCLNILLLHCFESDEFDIIDIAPYEHKSVEFTSQNIFIIFRYNLISLDPTQKSHLTLRSVENANSYQYSYQFCLYTNISYIQRIDDQFYNCSDSAEGTYSSITFTLNNGEYYLGIQYDKSDIEDTFYFFSTDFPYEINNTFMQDYYISYGFRSLTYIFSISSNLSKYIKFGSKNYDSGDYYSNNNVLSIITYKDGNNTLYRRQNANYVDYFKLNENSTYYFNLSIYLNYQEHYFFYLMKSNYSMITEVEKNKQDFDLLPVISNLYILLDVSSTPKNHKIIFEYSSYYHLKEKQLQADGFKIDDVDKIDKYIYQYEKKQNLDNSVNNVSLDVELEDCYGEEICKGYIIKRDESIKKIILNFEKDKNFNYIKFRYGSEEYVPPAHILYSSLIGLALAFPNIFLNIIRRIRNKMTASVCTIILNIIVNFAYGNILAVILQVGGLASLVLGIVLLVIYFLACLISLCMQKCCDTRAYFDVIFNLCDKLEDSKSFNEILSINRKLSPLVKVGCYAQHEESREVCKEYEKYLKPVYVTNTTYDRDGNPHYNKVFSHNETHYRYRTTYYSEWRRVDEGGGKLYNKQPGYCDSRYEYSVEYKTVETWRKELEYVYKSWQDNTSNINNIQFCSILEADFGFDFTFDQVSQSTLKQMKDNLFEEGKTYDTDVHTYNNFKVPGFYNSLTCSLNDVEYQRIQKKFATPCGYICWTILFLLGYSSIFDAYARYEIGSAKINIYKDISSEDNMRVPYKTDEVDLPGISISFVHTKIQQKSLEKKLKKGKIDEKDMEIPLFISN